MADRGTAHTLPTPSHIAVLRYHMGGVEHNTQSYGSVPFFFRLLVLLYSVGYIKKLRYIVRGDVRHRRKGESMRKWDQWVSREEMTAYAWPNL